MIKAVIFDMFETLVSLFEGRTYFSEDIAADLNEDLQAFKREWHDIERDRSTGKYTVEQAVETVLKRLGTYSEDKVKKAAAKRREGLSDTFSAVPEESIRLLEELKKRGIKIGLISNTYSDETEFIRNSILFPYFDEALISFEEGIMKPDIGLYKKMTKLLGLKPEECLYVGDGGSNELYAAREAGMHPVQCTWFYDMAFDPHVPSPILDEFEHADIQSDIINILEKYQ